MNPETGVEELVFPPQPNPEFEIQREELKVHTLEIQGKQELGVQDLEIKYMLAEAQVVAMIAKASKDADAPELARLQQTLDELEGKRKALTAIAVAEISAAAQKANANKRQTGGK